MKALTPEATDEWVQRQRADGLRIGYTCGAFDILHAGHVDYLQKARDLCDRLLVAVNSDQSIRTYKSPLRPVNREEERMAVVAALRCVDAVTQLDEPRPLSQLERWQPQLYIKGGDYETGGLRSAEAVRAYGGEIAVIPIVHETSTSTMIERILAIEAHEAPEKGQGTAQGIIFLDRDGTLIADPGFFHDASKVELLPGVGKGLARLQALGFRLVIVTNQQGIGLGYYSETEFIQVNQALFRLLARHDVKISRVLFCPHSLADACDCRKPGGLLLGKACSYYNVSPARCFIIGDRASDVEAGEKVGCRAVLVGEDSVPPNGYRAGSFLEAVEWIAGIVTKRD